MSQVLEALVKKGLINQIIATRLQKEAEVFGKDVEDIILERGIINEDALLKIKSELYTLPIKKVGKEEKVSEEILNLIPQNSAKNYNIVAFDKKENTLYVAALSPEDQKVQEVLRFLAQKLQMDVAFYLISRKDLKKLWQGYEKFSSEIEEAINSLKKGSITFKPPTKLINLEEALNSAGKEAPIIKIVSAILKHGVHSKASDIHIEPLRNKLRIRYRLDGTLHSSLYLPIELLSPIVSRIKILSSLKIDENRVPQDGRFSTLIDDKEIDYRVSTFPTAVGEKVAIRILDPEIGLKKLKDLGLVGRSREIVEKAIKRPYGMILITGPTGSGKTTTLYALLQELDREKINIVTLEDPVEYFIEGINQSQIKPDIGYTFASGLRQILRQDPDVILVGEIRDEETAALAVHASLTGHLVFSTLHTNSSIGAIPRLIDMGVPLYLLPSALSVIVAQRLVPRLCPFCKKEVLPTKEITSIIEDSLKNISEEEKKKRIKQTSPYKVFQSQGCPKCNNKGVKGRVALFEALEMTDELGLALGGGLDEGKIIEEAKRQGLVTMRQDGILKALEGIVSVEAVVKETKE